MSNVKNKKRIFIDFDGTIIDIKDKCYEVYKDGDIKFGFNIFNKTTYWKYKTNNYSEKEIILKNNKDSKIIDKYLSFRFNHIENKKYLNLDKLIVSLDRIKDITRFYDLYLITMRHKKLNLLWELKKLNIFGLFKEIIWRDNVSKNQNDFNQKKELLSRFYPFSSNDIMIGDTELDYLLGKHFSLKTFIVGTGSYNEKFLVDNYPKIKSILYYDINGVFINICAKFLCKNPYAIHKLKTRIF